MHLRFYPTYSFRSQFLWNILLDIPINRQSIISDMIQTVSLPHAYRETLTLREMLGCRLPKIMHTENVYVSKDLTLIHTLRKIYIPTLFLTPCQYLAIDVRLCIDSNASFSHPGVLVTLVASDWVTQSVLSLKQNRVVLALDICILIGQYIIGRHSVVCVLIGLQYYASQNLDQSQHNSMSNFAVVSRRIILQANQNADDAVSTSDTGINIDQSECKY